MRLEAAKIYKEFLMLRSDTLLTVLEENQVLNALWDAFTYFTSNNILHSTFVDMMFESYGTGNTSLDAYFHRSRVIEDILRLRKQLVVSKSKCLFRGHIDKLAEHIYIKLYQLPEHPYYWDSLVETFKDDIPDWIKGSPGKRMRAGRRNTVLETGDVADVGAAAVAVGYQLPSNPVQMPHLRELSNVDEDTDESDDGYDEDWYDPEKGSASADHGPPPRPPARVSAELRIAAGSPETPESGSKKEKKKKSKKNKEKSPKEGKPKKEKKKKKEKQKGRDSGTFPSDDGASGSSSARGGNEIDDELDAKYRKKKNCSIS
eukprot:TRINITY_DN6402_c0_g1_i4.p2 TRINITY_DN6402_c0_g1~~TRINITY_DN6402_c0_g1_i4.p2  ORF type:complete len:317 (+),score=66.72 TRINITY_DN6402_c0_g1_i4:1214-2164(+)